MEVRMVLECLSPGVQHRQKTDDRSQVLVIRGNLHQSVGCSPEQQTIDHPLVLKSQRTKLIGYSEHYVEVFDRQ
jgi:hypothetical protein